MPDETVYITELETEILSVFVKRLVLNDARIVEVLLALVHKLQK